MWSHDHNQILFKLCLISNLIFRRREVPPSWHRWRVVLDHGWVVRRPWLTMSLVNNNAGSLQWRNKEKIFMINIPCWIKLPCALILHLNEFYAKQSWILSWIELGFILHLSWNSCRIELGIILNRVFSREL